MVCLDVIISVPGVLLSPEAGAHAAPLRGSTRTQEESHGSAAACQADAGWASRAGQTHAWPSGSQALSGNPDGQDVHSLMYDDEPIHPDRW